MYDPILASFVIIFCFVLNQFPTLVAENSKNYFLKVMGLNQILNETIYPTNSCKFSIQVLLPTRFFKLAIGGTALKYK